jgi:hypothetical protein
MPSSYQEHCRTLGDLAEVMREVVKAVRPLQTFKDNIDQKGFKILRDLDDELTSIGNDGLSVVERAQRPPCAILLGTSSAGKTELLNSFLTRLREFSASTSSDTTPMLVRLRYPRTINPAEHGLVTFLMPRDLYKLVSDLPKVQNVVRRDTQMAEAWDRLGKVARDPSQKKDAAHEKKLHTALVEWSLEIFSWAKVTGNADDAEYFETLHEIAKYFDPEGGKFGRHNPLPRSLLINFLDKGEREQHIAKALIDKRLCRDEEAKEESKTYFMMRTCGAITQLFVDEDILKDIDVYDTAGVRVGGDEADILKPRQMVHSQIQAFKNRWGFERLVASVDIIIFILVLEEQQVDTEFQALFEEARKHGHLQNRLFIFLNKVDKATDQAIKNKQFKQGPNNEIIPDEEQSWKNWVQINVMDKIRGLGETFRNVFLTRATKFDFSQSESRPFLQSSKNSPTLNRYLYDVNANLDACLSNTDGGIKFAWGTVAKVMREQGSEIRYSRLGSQILPFAKDLLTILGVKRITPGRPSDKEIDTYMEKLMEDLKDLRWRNEEFRLPERFGEICIQKKFASSKQIEEALHIQAEGEKETGRRVRIGQILVDKKYMTLEQVREVLQYAERDQEDWDTYQEDTFKQVRERVVAQIVAFMEEKGRPIIKGNIPVEAVIAYLLEPAAVLEQELKGLYTTKERKAFQEAVQSVMECQLAAALWNQDRLRKHLWAQKPRITSSFHIRDDISEEEAIIVTQCYDKMRTVYDKLPPLPSIAAQKS